MHPVLFLIFLGLFLTPTFRCRTRNLITTFSLSSSKGPNQKEINESKDETIFVDGVERAFHLGKLVQHMKSLGCDKVSDGQCLYLFFELENLCGNRVTKENMKSFYRAILSDRPKFRNEELGVLHRVVSFISFANVLFVLGILSAFFALIHLIPFAFLLLKELSFVVVTIVMFILPVVETLFYIVSITLLIFSLACPVQYAFLVSFAGVIVSIVSFLYSAKVHLENDGGHFNDFLLVLFLFSSISFGVNAYVFQSSLMSWCFVACLFAAVLSYRFLTMMIVWLLGFFSLTFSIIVFEMINIAWKKEYVIFLMPNFIFGTIEFLFANYLWFHKRYFNVGFWRGFMRDIPFLGVSTILLTYGTSRNIEPLTNMVTISLTIYVFGRYYDCLQSFRRSVMFWLILLLGSGVMIYAALFIHLYIDVFVNIFDEQVFLK